MRGEASVGTARLASVPRDRVRRHGKRKQRNDQGSQAKHRVSGRYKAPNNHVHEERNRQGHHEPRCTQRTEPEDLHTADVSGSRAARHFGGSTTPCVRLGGAQRARARRRGDELRKVLGQRGAILGRRPRVAEALGGSKGSNRKRSGRGLEARAERHGLSVRSHLLRGHPRSFVVVIRQHSLCGTHRIPPTGITQGSPVVRFTAEGRSRPDVADWQQGRAKPKGPPCLRTLVRLPRWTSSSVR